jgi:LysM repeat protein
VRKWTKSACVVLAWGILPILVAVGGQSPVHRAQATHHLASSTAQVTLTSFTEVATPASTTKYLVHPGDTLSGIATALAVRGGWQALYAANRQAIGPNPNNIRVGTALVMPGQAPAVRYWVAPGDTLSGIATALAVRGGWQALYAANRQAIGPNPNIISVGTALTIPFLVMQARSAPQAHRQGASASAAKPAGQAYRPAPATMRGASLAAPFSMPRWLKSMLLAAGIVIGLALATEPVIAMGRRRAQGRRRRRAVENAGIIMTDYDRLIVTYCLHDDTVYVLTPPGEDPRAVLRAARLVVPEAKYRELAGQLGVAAEWPRE